jgi:quinol monooxygenase YgiN
MAGARAREGQFVIVAEFEVRPEGLERFLELAKTDASQSVAKEPGCRQFDVTVDRQENRVLLYEVYDDQAAFDAHLQTPHLAAFRAGIEPLVVSRNVRRLTRVHGRGGRDARLCLKVENALATVSTTVRARDSSTVRGFTAGSGVIAAPPKFSSPSDLCHDHGPERRLGTAVARPRQAVASRGRRC